LVPEEYLAVGRLQRRALAKAEEIEAEANERLDQVYINAFLCDAVTLTRAAKLDCSFPTHGAEARADKFPAYQFTRTLIGLAHLRAEVDKYSDWCAGTDPFAKDTRPRPLAPRTRQLRRDQIHAAVTALVESGVKPTAITSIADLVSPENFKRILRRRYEAVGGRENTFNHDLAQTLVQIGREWVEVDPDILVELRRLTGKVPMSMPGLTDKNKRALRQFDDQAVLRRLYNFPGRLWAEVKGDRKPNRYTLAKAQAALAIAILSYMSMRLQNLASLTFDIHLFMREGARAISSLEVPASEVKNRRALAYDIPPDVAKMIIEYCDCIAPRIVGHRPNGYL
jgi:hypothetical protein